MNKIRIMEASVRKWDRIIAGKRSDGGVIDCPPCRIYYMLVCFGCPIAQHTGRKFCKGSPYIPWYRHQLEVHDKMFRKVYCPECKRLAGDMRDFMKEIVKHLKAQRYIHKSYRSLVPKQTAAAPPSLTHRAHRKLS